MSFVLQLLSEFLGRLLMVGLLLIPIFLPKKKGYEYNRLDKTGIICNIVLSAVYVLLSIAGIFTIFFADAPTINYSVLKNNVLTAVVCVGFSVPVVSYLSIFASVLARKRGKSKFSFLVQFVPIPIFLVLLFLIEWFSRIA